MSSRRQWLRWSLGGTASGALGWCAPFAVADGLNPQRPVSLILPYAPGGGLDGPVRALAAALEARLERRVLVEHRAGAGGLIGAELAARAAPDGHTLLLGGLNHLVQARLQANARLQPLSDFAPIGLTGSSGGALVVAPQSGLGTLEGLLAHLRRATVEPAYGSGGLTTLSHLAAASMLAHTSLRARHVPYRGSTDLAGALFNGDILFAVPIQGTVQRLVDQGRLVALAVTTPQRSPVWPTVPTLTERLGTPDVVVEGWSGLWAPAATPEPIIRHLHAALDAALSEAAVRDAFLAAGATPRRSPSPAAFAAYMRAEDTKAERWARLAAAEG